MKDDGTVTRERDPVKVAASAMGRATANRIRRTEQVAAARKRLEEAQGALNQAQLDEGAARAEFDRLSGAEAE